MTLGNFYDQTEKIIINDLVSYLSKSRPIMKIRILNIYTSQTKTISESPMTTDIKIGDKTNDFLRSAMEYSKALNGRKYDIVNCRFSLRDFMSNITELAAFIGFISDALRPGGYFMGFMLDINRLSGIFSETMTLTGGPYKIEYQQFGSDIDTPTVVIINGETNNIIDFSVIESLCQNFGLRHVDNVILESLYNNSLHYVTLQEYEKQFGFLNYVFLFQKM